MCVWLCINESHCTSECVHVHVHLSVCLLSFRSCQQSAVRPLFSKGHISRCLWWHLVPSLSVRICPFNSSRYLPYMLSGCHIIWTHKRDISQNCREVNFRHFIDFKRAFEKITVMKKWWLVGWLTSSEKALSTIPFCCSFFKCIFTTISLTFHSNMSFK